MLKIIGNDIRRGTAKIGWIEDNDIRDHTNKKIGYFSANDIYKANGVKIGFIEGNNLYIANGPTLRVDDVRERHVVGGSIPDLARAAAMILFGD